MSWLEDILKRGRRLRAKECGSELPDNPTLEDFKKEANRIYQLAKVEQNINHRWSDDQWRRISKAVENL